MVSLDDTATNGKEALGQRWREGRTFTAQARLLGSVHTRGAQSTHEGDPREGEGMIDDELKADLDACREGVDLLNEILHCTDAARLAELKEKSRRQCEDFRKRHPEQWQCE